MTIEKTYLQYYKENKEFYEGLFSWDKREWDLIAGIATYTKSWLNKKCWANYYSIVNESRVVKIWDKYIEKPTIIMWFIWKLSQEWIISLD